MQMAHRCRLLAALQVMGAVGSCAWRWHGLEQKLQLQVLQGGSRCASQLACIANVKPLVPIMMQAYMERHS